MNRLVTSVLKIMLMVAVLGLLSCREQAAPALHANVVKQKITIQPSSSEQPATASLSPAVQAALPQTAIRNELAKELETKPAEQTAPQTAAADPQPTEQTAPQTVELEKQPAPDAVSDLIKESMQIVSAYDPKGRFDPFEPLFKEQPTEHVAAVSKDKRQKRIPQTPLERVALSQLKLSAVIRAPSGNRALVEDATGKGYVVENGTYIGLNAGQVTHIERDRIVVEEEIENVLGELTIQNSELKLQKPAGEL